MNGLLTLPSKAVKNLADGKLESVTMSRGR